ncbi:MAG: cytochrome c oxidase subunit 3 [Anaerolineae bacterium]|nr:cytochrome c oxidase subunit 3 [Thermoflexales bacterium]MDW8406569.1 cytochrome c oxidase subunit 3 [Anaerolineae bacterium]
MERASVLVGTNEPALSVGKAEREAQVNRRLGFWLFLASELLIFCGLIGGFLVVKGYAATWPEHELGSILLASVNTFALLASSLTVVLGIDAIRMRNQRDRLALFLGISAALGALFLGGQAIEYKHFIVDLGHGFGDPFGTAFFVLTGLHGLHVLVGVVWAAMLIARARQGAYTSENYTTVEMFGLYWHFVDLVWILIFTIVYLI